MTAEAQFDYVIVGGGLAGGLTALAIAARRPRARVALVEGGARLAGNHTWSFHDSDVTPEMARLLEPAVVGHWPSVEVAFPDGVQEIATGYQSISSGAFAGLVVRASDREGSSVVLGTRVERMSAHEVTLADGRRLGGQVVLDARGLPATRHFETTGFQKFVGVELELDQPLSGAAARRPLLMDARVAQLDGYRFVYVLPFSSTRVLVEDTYFSDTPELDVERVDARLDAYRVAHGLAGRVVRREQGVLPLPWGHLPTPPLGSPFRIGTLGGWFHPTTGYSLPVAARVAQLIAEHEPAGVGAALVRLFRAHRSSFDFAQGLNRLLFRATPPAERWRTFARFYRLPRATIERFYALDVRGPDRARILGGRPPAGVSVKAALFPTVSVQPLPVVSP